MFLPLPLFIQSLLFTVSNHPVSSISKSLLLIFTSSTLSLPSDNLHRNLLCDQLIDPQVVLRGSLAADPQDSLQVALHDSQVGSLHQGHLINHRVAHRDSLHHYLLINLLDNLHRDLLINPRHNHLINLHQDLLISQQVDLQGANHIIHPYSLRVFSIFIFTFILTLILTLIL